MRAVDRPAPARAARSWPAARGGSGSRRSPTRISSLARMMSMVAGHQRLSVPAAAGWPPAAIAFAAHQLGAAQVLGFVAQDFARSAGRAAARRCGTRGSRRCGARVALDQRRAGAAADIGAVAAGDQHAVFRARPRCAARARRLTPPPTMIASFRKGSIRCGGSVGMDVSARRDAGARRDAHGLGRRIAARALAHAQAGAGRRPSPGTAAGRGRCGAGCAPAPCSCPTARASATGCVRNMPEMPHSVSPDLTV